MRKIQFLLGINESHNPVSVSTVSSWIKAVIPLSGIDVSLLKGHCTRLASTSTASLCGTSIQEILGESRLSSESTWQKFYKNPLVSMKNKFEDRTLCNNAFL